MKRVKKGVIKELFSEIGVFLVKKGSYTTLQAATIWTILKKIGQIRKSWSITIKRSSEILGVKMEFFCILVCEIFSRPPKLGARSPPMPERHVIEEGYRFCGRLF